MKTKLSFRETISITSLLFGLFFGAGNLIFPAKLGLDSGGNIWPAFAGVFVSAVGLPMLAVVALGISRSDGVVSLASRISSRYSKVFSLLLLLTIGPLFAIPRCASASFSVGAVNLINSDRPELWLAGFSFLFFAAVLFFALRPSNIMVWVGKVMNPLFLLFLGGLIVAALINPVNTIADVAPVEAYGTAPTAFFKGFLEGYNTLDALAGLVFGVIIVRVVRDYGVEESDRVAINTAKAGVFSCLLMGAVYFLIALVSCRSAQICSECTDGGQVLGVIAGHYFRSAGAVLMAAIVTVACMKTAVGLVTSCSEEFVKMFPSGPRYKAWAIIFTVVSFAIANLGLSTIVAWCVPVLMFLYPLAITLTFLALFFGPRTDRREVWVCVTAVTVVVAAFDCVGAVCGIVEGVTLLESIRHFAETYLPLYNYGLGWVVPAVAGALLGEVIHIYRKMCYNKNV